MMISPAFAYEKAPDQTTSRGEQTRELFKEAFATDTASAGLNHSPLFLDSRGKQDFQCTAGVFPVTPSLAGSAVLLMADGYATSYKSCRDHRLVAYGRGRDERCANCMATAATNRRRDRHHDSLRESIRAMLGTHSSSRSTIRIIS